MLAVDPSAQFTAPNLITNKYALVNLTGSYDITDTTSLQGLAYYDYFLQKVVNGNVPNVIALQRRLRRFLCAAPGVFATDRNGNPIPDFLNGGPYSDLDQQSTNTNGYGASLQVTNRDELFGHANQLVAGFSFDGAQTLFSGSTQIGGLSLPTASSPAPASPSTRPTARSRRCGSASPMPITALFFTDTFDVTSAAVGQCGRPLQLRANRSATTSWAAR